MLWDNIAGVYDIFEKVINKKTNQDLCVQIEAKRKLQLLKHRT